MNDEWMKQTSSLSEEMHVLLEFLRWDNRTDSKRIIEQAADWRQVLHLAQHHRVIPNLYTVIIRSDELSIPLWVRKEVKLAYQQNTIQMLHLTAEMERVCKLLDFNNIRTLVLKGPTLAYELYGDISLRTSSDLDILVPLENLELASNLLQENGYEKDEYIETILNDWKWRHHHLNFIHPVKKTKVELHWRLGPGPAKEPGFDHLWNRRRQCKVSFYPVYVLCQEDLFLFLASHGARHGWSRLRWLVDIDRLSKQNLNWGKLQQLSKRYWQEQLVGQSLQLSRQLLNTPNSGFKQSARIAKRSEELALQAMFYIKQMINLHTPPLPSNIGTYHKNYLFAAMSFRQKCLFILSFLHPYPSDAKLLPLPKLLHIMYFPFRPFLVMWKITKRLSAGGSR